MDALSQRLRNLGRLAGDMAAAAPAYSRSLERLSSGVSVQGAGDDSARLALSATTSLDSRLYTQAIRNINEGISLTSITALALDSLDSLTAQMSELAIRAQSSVVTADQRVALDSELAALREEFERVRETSQYNGIKLLSGTEQTITTTAAKGLKDSIAISSGGDYL